MSSHTKEPINQLLKYVSLNTRRTHLELFQFVSLKPPLLLSTNLPCEEHDEQSISTRCSQIGRRVHSFHSSTRCQSLRFAPAAVEQTCNHLFPTNSVSGSKLFANNNHPLTAPGDDIQWSNQPWETPAPSWRRSVPSWPRMRFRWWPALLSWSARTRTELRKTISWWVDISNN